MRCERILLQLIVIRVLASISFSTSSHITLLRNERRTDGDAGSLFSERDAIAAYVWRRQTGTNPTQLPATPQTTQTMQTNNTNQTRAVGPNTMTPQTASPANQTGTTPGAAAPGTASPATQPTLPNTPNTPNTPTTPNTPNTPNMPNMPNMPSTSTNQTRTNTPINMTQPASPNGQTGTPPVTGPTTPATPGTQQTPPMGNNNQSRTAMPNNTQQTANPSGQTGSPATGAAPAVPASPQTMQPGTNQSRTAPNTPQTMQPGTNQSRTAAPNTTPQTAPAAGAAAPAAAGPAPATGGACSISTTIAPVNDPKLPNPFVFASGAKVASKADFACRQQEMQAAMEQYELGEYPKTKGTVRATMSGAGLSISVTVGSASIQMSAKINGGAKGGKGSPGIIQIGGFSSLPIPSGVAAITFDNDGFADQAGRGSHGKGLFYQLFGSTHSAGALTAWAWGVGRVIDALEQLGPNATGIDPTRLGVTGCSRNGKGAFIVAALEKRIALGLPQESGSGGAACWRLSMQEKANGKHIEVISNTADESWFSTRMDAYTSKVDTMPEDHHFLPGLVAPRGLLVTENDIDWLGPGSTTPCMRAGREIYKALGVKTNMGFSLSGGHGHCQFPSAQAPELTAYINAFLLGSGAAPDVDKSPVTMTAASVASWTAPTLA